MQRIIVKNFGPLKDIDLEIKDYMIFIGPQASGKSTLAKLIYFGKTLGQAIISNSIFIIRNFKTPFQYLKDTKNYLPLFIDNYLNNFFSSEYLKEIEIEIYYSEIKYFKISSKSDNELLIDVNIDFNEKYIFLLDEAISNFEAQFKDFTFNSRLEIATEELLKYVKGYFGFTKINYFVPASRSLFTILSNQLFSIKTENLDYLLRTFFDEIHFLRYDTEKGLDLIKTVGNYDKVNTAKSLTNSIIKGKYVFDDDESYIKIESGEKLKLYDTSSGQQEAIWITQMITANLREILFAIIEEPEAHLYPEAQRDMTYLISLLANQEGNQVVITTHSPYILASLNNLILAQSVGQKHPEEVEKVGIPKELWVNPDRLFVGYMEQGKPIEDIYDKENRIIKHEILDGVSEQIMSDFNKLYDIELAVNEEL